MTSTRFAPVTTVASGLHSPWRTPDMDHFHAAPPPRTGPGGSHLRTRGTPPEKPAAPTHHCEKRLPSTHAVVTGRHWGSDLPPSWAWLLPTSSIGWNPWHPGSSRCRSTGRHVPAQGCLLHLLQAGDALGTIPGQHHALEETCATFLQDQHTGCRSLGSSIWTTDPC